MSSEIEITETPNWLKDLEAKREKRLKTKLGHETGAGAPCLKCGDKCPGLDLHFWRKCCKLCRCSKEEHEVQDDDIYGWAQFQLLGNKPSKTRKKIVLPGKKDELELDWVPKGHNDVVDKYLQTLPPDQLPVKGSQAAQERKQMLQKQIPIHDIDPTLCHELNEDELEKMNNYIEHVKKSCVGVGQIVNLSSIIKRNLHMLNPNDAALIASRYPKGIPLSEIVKLQSMSKTDPLKQHSLTQNLQNLNVKDKTLQNYSPNIMISREETMSPISVNKMHDKNYASYMPDADKLSLTPEFSGSLNKQTKPLMNQYTNQFPSEGEIEQIGYNTETANQDNRYTQKHPYFGSPINKPRYGNTNPTNVIVDPILDAKLLQNPNFNPKNVPSQFIRDHLPQGPNVGNLNFHEKNVPLQDILKDPKYTGSAFVPYLNTVTNEHLIAQPQYSKNASSIGDSQKYAEPLSDKNQWENVNHLKNTSQGMPNYGPGSYHQITDLQTPQAPKNVKDLAFSTYNSNTPNKISELSTLQGNINPQNEKEDLINTRRNLNYEGIPKQISYGQQFGPTDENMKPVQPTLYDKNRLYNVSEINSNEIPRAQSGFSNTLNNPQGLGLSSIPNYRNLPNSEVQEKKLTSLQPGNLSITEDFLEPSQVSIGAIQDINFPEIKAAVQGTNDFYEDYSPDSIKEILNNVKLPDCHYCKKPFEEREFAITIERANALFHADCFRCAGCNQILADNVYFYSKENDNVYCGRDYAKIRGFPRCKACDELIFTKEYCLAEHNTFHLKHFCCTQCDTPLAGQDYIIDEQDIMPYCLPCYEMSKADCCNSCNRVIKPDEVGCTLNELHFHANDECFACKVCHKPLMKQKLLLRNKKLYCSHACYGTEQ